MQRTPNTLQCFNVFLIRSRLRLDLNHEEKDQNYAEDSFSLSHFLNPFPPFMFIYVDVLEIASSSSSGRTSEHN